MRRSRKHRKTIDHPADIGPAGHLEIGEQRLYRGVDGFVSGLKFGQRLGFEVLIEVVSHLQDRCQLRNGGIAYRVASPEGLEKLLYFLGQRGPAGRLLNLQVLQQPLAARLVYCHLGKVMA